LGDGTIRWYQLQTGKELLAFFPHADGKRWVLWTPKGFFADGDSGGRELIEYHLNRGLDKEREVVKVEQLYDLFYRPDLVALALKDEGRKQIADALAQVGDVRKVLAVDELPPEVEIVSSQRRGTDLLIKYRVKDKGGGVGKVVFKVNGVEQETRAAHAGIPGLALQEAVIPLSPNENTIELKAYNRGNTVESTPAATRARLDIAELAKPSLYVLAVGVSDYRDQSLKLTYAAADAKAVAAMLENGGKGLFGSIQPTVLPDREATLNTTSPRRSRVSPVRSRSRMCSCSTWRGMACPLTMATTISSRRTPFTATRPPCAKPASPRIACVTCWPRSRHARALSSSIPATRARPAA
jgi:hypothetical protein